MTARQFTHCVKREDYTVLNIAPEKVAAIIGLFVPAAGWSVTIGAVLWAAQDICEFITGGKLICLDGDRCAIGRIGHIEPVGFEKTGEEKIDDDFSLNIVLAPQLLGQFVGKSREANLTAAQSGPQGDLITEQSGMGEPYEPVKDGSHFNGYTRAFTSFPYDDPSTHPIEVDSFEVPVLHAECEGSRIHDVCDAVMKALAPLPGLEKVCSFKIFGIPFGRYICTIANIAKAPAILIAVGKAWLGAEGGNVTDVMEGGGTVEVGDFVVVTGRWVWDGGHSGWNEFHPLKRLQKVDRDTYFFGNFDDYRKTWCDRIDEVPPDAEPGEKPEGMTPSQEGIWDSQRRPENLWDLHPSIDGCDVGNGTLDGTGTFDGVTDGVH
jgi:hypothetical protein